MWAIQKANACHYLTRIGLLSKGHTFVSHTVRSGYQCLGLLAKFLTIVQVGAKRNLSLSHEQLLKVLKTEYR
jgi:hypothetical protein